jgi:hypothetical protein
MAAGFFGIQDTLYDVAETAGSVTVTIAREGGTDGSVDVFYNVLDGTATEGDDYVGVPANSFVTFADGQETADIQIQIIDDDDDVFTHQLMGGVAYGFTENLEATGGIRYRVM